MAGSALAVTFDVGQTLTELDCDLLSDRLASRGVQVSAASLELALPTAWELYDAACAHTAHPWHLLMSEILRRSDAQLSAGELGDEVEWLWTQQPVHNLWRRPIAGMIEVVRAVAAAGTKVAIISNSEGRLRQLIEELGWQDDFLCIADSGLLGVAKPDPEIFRWTGRKLDVDPANFVHIGDSWSADVQGVLGVGGRAIWFGGASIAPSPPANAYAGDTLRLCRSAPELRLALQAFGVPL